MPDKIDELLQQPIIVINLGVKQFAESLVKQSVEAIQVDWAPAAGGDKEMIDLLDKLL